MIDVLCVQVMLVHSDDKQAHVTILNLFTGALIRDKALTHPVTQVIPLKGRVHEGPSDQLVFLFASFSFPAKEQLPLAVYPDSPETCAIATAAAAYTFAWAANEATGAV